MTKERMIQILEENKNLIENKNFQKFYDNLDEYDRPYFTDLFLKSDINPLEYMKEVPTLFAWRLKIKNIEIPNNVIGIGAYAFNSCDKLINVIISEGVKNIQSLSFAYCSSLTSITLPKSIKYIDSDIFYASKKLKNIYYKGSREDWNKIEIEEEGNKTWQQRVKIHFNS